MERKMKRPENKTFRKRAMRSAKKHAGTAIAMVIVSTITSTLTGTLIPLWQQWHSDAATAEAIAAVRISAKEDLQDYKAQVAEKLGTFSLEQSKMWSYINEDEANFGNKLHVVVRHRWMGMTTTNTFKP